MLVSTGRVERTERNTTRAPEIAVSLGARAVARRSLKRVVLGGLGRFQAGRRVVVCKATGAADLTPREQLSLRRPIPAPLQAGSARSAQRGKSDRGSLSPPRSFHAFLPAAHTHITLLTQHRPFPAAAPHLNPFSIPQPPPGARTDTPNKREKLSATRPSLRS